MTGYLAIELQLRGLVILNSFWGAVQNTCGGVVIFHKPSKILFVVDLIEAFGSQSGSAMSCRAGQFRCDVLVLGNGCKRGGAFLTHELR